MTVTQTSNKNAGDLIRDRIPFNGSNFQGVLMSLTPECFEPVMGMLPYTSLRDLEGAEYIVYSYATPIAWFKNGGWQVPSYKYSVSTSRHQSIVRNAIGMR